LALSKSIVSGAADAFWAGVSWLTLHGRMMLHARHWLAHADRAATGSS
jgi:hypothetical protein